MEDSDALNPSFSDKSKHYYMATLKESETVIDSFIANFTWSPKSERDFVDMQVSNYFRR